MFATLETLLRKTFSVYQTVTHFPSLANDPLFRITVPGKRNFEKEKPDRQTEYNSRREERIFQATRESGQLSENLSSNVNFERMVPKLRYEPGERREIFSLRDFISFFFFFFLLFFVLQIEEQRTAIVLARFVTRKVVLENYCRAFHSTQKQISSEHFALGLLVCLHFQKQDRQRTKNSEFSARIFRIGLRLIFSGTRWKIRNPVSRDCRIPPPQFSITNTGTGRKTKEEKEEEEEEKKEKVRGPGEDYRRAIHRCASYLRFFSRLRAARDSRGLREISRGQFLFSLSPPFLSQLSPFARAKFDLKGISPLRILRSELIN